jgi:hypothetical protein
MGVVSILGLLIGYFIIFCFYAAGLFGDGPYDSPVLWERTLRATILIGPFLGGFLLMGFLAWREKWSTGVLPWAVGLTGVLLLARRDAGILIPLDAVWAVAILFMAAQAGKKKESGDLD